MAGPGHRILFVVLVAYLATPAFGGFLRNVFSSGHSKSSKASTSPARPIYTSNTHTSMATDIDVPNTDTSCDGGNGKIFFPYKRKLSETYKVNKLYGNQNIPEVVSHKYYLCNSNTFISVNGRVHFISPDEEITEAEEHAGYNEGICTHVDLRLFYENSGNNMACYSQTVINRREYDYFKDTYNDIHVDKKKKCDFESEAELLSSFNKEFLKFVSMEKEPNQIQNIVLVVYDCKTPNIPLNSHDQKIWKFDGNTLRLESDGTREHVQNLRNARCRALGSYAMTMYENVPMANSTAIMYNCPDGVDGYEERVGNKYVRKWRNDWASDNCYPSITKTQLDYDGNLQSITATNFQSDDMKIEFGTPKRVRDVGKAILRKAETFLDLFPKVTVSGNIVKTPSYVRRYFQ